MKKAIRYMLGTLALLLLVFFSFDIRKLDAYRALQPVMAFDAVAYAREVWDRKLPGVVSEAPDIGSVLSMLDSAPERAFKEMGRQLGISRTWYFMATGTGTVDSVGEENLWVTLVSGERVALATSFIFGNTVRDGSGVVDIDDFVNMTDFNNVSVAINQLVKEEVAKAILKKAGPGVSVEFAGAFEISEDNIELNAVRVIPVTAKLTDEKQ
jgi:predicted lipoprotein